MDRSNTMQIYDLRRTCIACPSQWEGRVNDAGSIYIRYRWGRLTARLSMTDGNAVAEGTCVYDDDIGGRTGDRLGGYMETAEMQAALEGICRFNGECDEEYWAAEHSDMISISSDELQQDVDRYLDLAETQPVFITRDGHVRLVMTSFAEYQRLLRSSEAPPPEDGTTFDIRSKAVKPQSERLSRSPLPFTPIPAAAPPVPA